MPKAFLTLVVVALVLAGTATEASARASHNDPRDSKSALDIRTVATTSSRRNIVFGVKMYNQFSATDVDFSTNSGIYWLLDTQRRGRWDWVVVMGFDASQNRFECRVFPRGGNERGERPAFRVGANATLGCSIPKKWLGARKRTSRYGVETYVSGQFADRAPNRGRYQLAK
jgi:hypothetical protein